MQVMQQITMAQAYRTKMFHSLSKLRRNENQYPYLTLLVTNGSVTKSQNVYFGIKSSNMLEDVPNGANITSMLKDASIVLTTNKSGETRYKISLQGVESAYASTSELDDMFGVESEADFDIAAFKAGYASNVATETPAPNAPAFEG